MAVHLLENILMIWQTCNTPLLIIDYQVQVCDAASSGTSATSVLR